MHIIALAWIYVVLMMAVTETSVIAGIMTFVFYCVIPLGLVWFIFTHFKRQRNTTKDNKKMELKN